MDKNLKYIEEYWFNPFKKYREGKMDEKVKIELAFKHQKFSGLIINDEFVDEGEVVNYIFNLERKLGETLRESQPKTFLDDPAENIYTEEDGIPLEKRGEMDEKERKITEVILENGKYIFIIAEDGKVVCLRFGEPWIKEFEEGLKALISLIHHVSDLQQKLNTTRERTEGLEKILKSIKSDPSIVKLEVENWPESPDY